MHVNVNVSEGARVSGPGRQSYVSKGIGRQGGGYDNKLHLVDEIIGHISSRLYPTISSRRSPATTTTNNNNNHDNSNNNHKPSELRK